MVLFRRFSQVSLLILFYFLTYVYATDKFTSYLFTYFTGNDNKKAQEAIRFAISDDAHTFKALNKNNPVLSSAQISSTGGVRDPHILRGEKNDYYMVATDMVSANGWASNHGIVMLKSSNLIDWKSSAVDMHEHFPSLKTADRVWAPQTIYDPTVGKYMVYFAMRLGPSDYDKIYYAYADSSFTKLETEPKVLYSYGTTAAIDADIIYKDSTWHLFFKTEGSSQKGIKSATSKAPAGPYTLYDKYLQQTSDQVEGSCVFQLINSDTFVLMYDVYNAGRYEFALSTDLRTFKKDPKPISFDFTPRHGTIIPITENEKWTLLAKWNPTAAAERPPLPDAERVAYHLSQRTLTVSFDRCIPDRRLDLVDLSGKIVRVLPIPTASARIGLTGLPPGLYHVVTSTPSGYRAFFRICLR